MYVKSCLLESCIELRRKLVQISFYSHNYKRNLWSQYDNLSNSSNPPPKKEIKLSTDQALYEL